MESHDDAHVRSTRGENGKLDPRQKGIWQLLKATVADWNNDKCPQMGAALAYFTVFSLAPLVLVLLAVIGFFFGTEHARDQLVGQLKYFIAPSAIKAVRDIAANTSKPSASIFATVSGIIIALFGASGVFGQLQDALNSICRVKPKPGRGLWAFLRGRFLSFGMVVGVCFLLLVSLTIEGVLRSLSTYLSSLFPGGHIIVLTLFLKNRSGRFLVYKFSRARDLNFALYRKEEVIQFSLR